MKRVTGSAAVLLGVVLLTACGKKAEPEPPAPPPRSEQPPTMPARDDDGEARARAEAEARAREERARRRTLLEERVYFAYDRFDLDAVQQETLRRKVEVLRADQTIRLRVEGHADERGSLEYNLALGMRRAQSVKDYLTGFGLDNSRFTVESLGEDRPADRGTTEAAYARNRRAEFVITAGLNDR
jgi:peptidoglycan-associated lipoprotein